VFALFSISLVLSLVFFLFFCQPISGQDIHNS